MANVRFFFLVLVFQNLLKMTEKLTFFERLNQILKVLQVGGAT